MTDNKKWREFYAYPGSLERADEVLDLGDQTNITISYYPHVKYQLEKYGLIKFIEKAAYQDLKERAGRLAEEYINADKCFAVIADDALKQLAEKDLLLSECCEALAMAQSYFKNDFASLKPPHHSWDECEFQVVQALEKLKGKAKDD